MQGKVSRRILARTLVAKLVAEPSKQKQWLQALAAYLVQHSRADESELIINDIAHELFGQTGRLLVDVSSARPLNDAARTQLKKSLKEATHATHIDLSEQVDRSLLGGLTARTADAQLDVSVRNRLKQLVSIK